MSKKILLIGLVATSLVALLETETRAVLNIGGAGSSGCFCVSAAGQCKTSTNCDRSRDGGTCNAASGPTRCPIASLERSEFFAAAPGPEQMEICADTSSPEPLVTFGDTSSPEPIATFADTPSPEQIATFAVLPNSEPRIILVAKPTTPIEPAPNAYECFSFGAGAGNLDNNPAAISCAFRPDRVAVRCQNPGGGDGGQGTPFFPGVTLTGANALDAEDISGRGKWFQENIYTQEQIFTAIDPNASVACKDNWTVIPNTLTILESTVDIRTNRCADGTTPESCEASIIQPPDDRWISSCTVGTSNLIFNCTTVVHCLDLDGAARNACLCQEPSPC